MQLNKEKHRFLSNFDLLFVRACSVFRDSFRSALNLSLLLFSCSALATSKDSGHGDLALSTYSETDRAQETEDTKITGKALSTVKDLLNTNWQVTGFATVGYTQSSKYDDRLFRRNITQNGAELESNGFLVDSRLGLQLKSELNDHWELVFQGVLKEQYASNWGDYIDVAFARYRASDEWQFTFGRQPFDLFIMSDHINVGYSYDFVRPPTEFYGYIPFDSYDGLGITRTWGDFDSEWSLDFSVGFLDEEFESDSFEEDDFNEPDGNGSQNDDKTKAEPIYNAALNWRSNEWHLRANFALLEFELQFDDAGEFDQFVDLFAPIWQGPRQVRDAFLVNNKMRYFSVGGAWQSNGWKVQSEVSVIDADFAYYNGERAYVHVSKRFGDWLPYATLGYANDDSRIAYQRIEDVELPPDFTLLPDLVAIQADFDEEITGLRTNQHSLGLGIRWDFASQKAIKFQCDKYWFEPGSGSVHGRKDNQYLNSETRSWCSLNMDWVF